MKKNKKWHIIESEVSKSIGGSSRSGRHSNISRQSRAQDVRSLQITLVHMPTKIEVTGFIQEGNYTRNELKEKKNKKYEELLIDLENKVARFLRIPGR